MVIPPPVIVIVPVLAAPVFALTSMKIVPLPDPEDGETVSHDVALLDAVQDTFDVIFADVPPANEGGFQDVRDTSSDDVVGGGAAVPAWVTVTVFVIPPPVTVIAPVLAVVFVLAAAISVSMALPVPFAGETVNHDDALLVALHDTFDMMLTPATP